ncbi:MAG: PilN domain-containing protein, partial [Dictyoglomus sp.]
MIRINLLPKRELKKREDVKKQLILFLLIILFVVTGSIYYHMFLSDGINALENSKKQKEIELKKYEEIVKRVNEMEKNINSVKKRIELITNISIYRSAVIRSLDQVINAIPQNKVYLRQLTHSKEIISLDGTAQDHDSVAEFMDKLKLQEDIKGVFLKNAALKNIQGAEAEVVDFS